MTERMLKTKPGVCLFNTPFMNNRDGGFLPLFKTGTDILKPAAKIKRKAFTKTRVKRVAVIILLFMLSFVPYMFASSYAAQDLDELEKELSQTTSEQLTNLNLEQFDSILAALGENAKAIFGNGSFRSKVNSIISGEFRIGFDNMFSAVLGLVFSEVIAFLPYLFSIIAIAILGNLLTQMRANTASSSTHTLINSVTFSAVVIMVFVIIVQLINITKSAVSGMQSQINIAFPVLLTLMTALGNVNSVASYQPVAATLANVITQVMIMVVLPMFIFSIVFSVVGNISPNVKISKLAGFFGSISKWLIGIVFMLFMAFLTIQGVAAATYDGVSVRTAKYALSRYVPIIGGYLSEGLNIMLAGTVLIKNAVGVTGILLLVSVCIMPVIKIAVFSLGLKLCGAVLEPISDSRISKFVTSVSKHTSMLVAIILSVAFMYFLTLMLIIVTGNTVVTG